MIEQQTLFSADLKKSPTNEKGIDVVKATFDTFESNTWEELFDGFNELYVITFSSGIDFTAQVLERFDYAEIIYGCEHTRKQDEIEMLKAQGSIITSLFKKKASKKLAERINEGSLELYISKDAKSHEKLYILKSHGGNTRVITGSANMSRSAFCGFQRENIIYFDDVKAYDYYMKRFADYKEQCANKVEESLVGNVIENPDYLQENVTEIPIVQEAKHITIEIDQETDGDVDIIREMNSFEKTFNAISLKREGTSKKPIINFETINLAQKINIKRISKKKEQRYPKLRLNIEEGKLYFNGKEQSLNPTKEEIQNDVSAIVSFLNGLDSFNGDVSDAKKQYFRYLNWYFSTIFAPYLRKTAEDCGYNIHSIPMFGVMAGKSNAGKTTFNNLLSKLMTGRKIKSASSTIFTKTRVAGERMNSEGVPINIEDLPGTQFNANYEGILKDDLFGIVDNLKHYPAISITSNTIKSLTPDATKRVVYLNTDIALNKTDGIRNAKIINDSIKTASNALFREYVKNMLPVVDKMYIRMMNEDKNYFPDLLKDSSLVLNNIFRLHMEKNCDYVKDVSYEDYFGDRAIGKKAIQKVLNYWETQKDKCAIDKKNNTLCLRFENRYDAINIANELPAELNANCTAGTLVLDLSESQRFFNLSFKKGWFK